MANIYESALVTLAPTKAPNHDNDLFSDANTKHASRLMTLKSRGYQSRDEAYTIHARDSLPHEHDLPKAFQERVLSRRTIHLTEQELGFECAAYHQCKCSSESSLLNDIQSLRAHSTLDLLTQQKHWQEVVTTYTIESLMYLTDIFPALQGLSKRAGKPLGHFYARHWETTLTYSLTWFRGRSYSSQPRARPQTPQNWRAQS